MKNNQSFEQFFFYKLTKNYLSIQEIPISLSRHLNFENMSKSLNVYLNCLANPISSDLFTLKRTQNYRKTPRFRASFVINTPSCLKHSKSSKMTSERLYSNCNSIFYNNNFFLYCSEKYVIAKLLLDSFFSNFCQFCCHVCSVFGKYIFTAPRAKIPA